MFTIFFLQWFACVRCSAGLFLAKTQRVARDLFFFARCVVGRIALGRPDRCILPNLLEKKFIRHDCIAFLEPCLNYCPGISDLVNRETKDTPDIVVCNSRYLIAVINNRSFVKIWRWRIHNLCAIKAEFLVGAR